MNSLIVVSLLLSPTAVNALKLLTSDAITETSLEDDDDGWESDVAFSYKPFKGKCMATASAGTKKTNVPNSPEYDGNGGTAATQGKLTRLVCGGEQAPKDLAYYCNAPSPSTINKQFDTQWGAWKTYLVNAKKIRKCPAYFAKLATMGNKKLTAANEAANGANSNLVKSFDYPVSGDCDARANTQVAIAGQSSTATTHLCYTEAGMTWAKNDPVVKNMNGDEFEILATGIFSLLTIKQPDAQTLFEAAATIDRAGTRCGATYIQNMTLGGQWIEDIGVPQIQIKAEPAVPKAKALQVNFNGEWQPTTSHLAFDVVKHANANKINLKINSLDITVSVDSHRIHEAGTKTNRFANFLNVNFGKMSGMYGFFMGGLLGKDSHEAAIQLPEECESTRLLEEKSPKMLSELELS